METELLRRGRIQQDAAFYGDTYLLIERIVALEMGSEVVTAAHQTFRFRDGSIPLLRNVQNLGEADEVQLLSEGGTNRVLI